MVVKTYKIPDKSENTPPIKAVWAICPQEAEGDEEFLEKILAAVQVNMKTQVWIQYHNESDPKSSIVQIINQKKPTKVLFFGILPSTFGLHIDIEPYKIHAFRNMELLWAEKLAAISEDKDKKMKLWMALQELFPKK